jgi:hypothetical protein
VAALKTKIEKGYVPLEVIKEPLKPLVIREKKAELLMNKLNTVLAKGKDLNAVLPQFAGTKIDTVDVAFASANIPNFGHEPKLTGNIFAAKKGVFSGPLKVNKLFMCMFSTS